MKAMLLNAYGENAVFETAEVAKPEVYSTGGGEKQMERGI